MNRPIIDIPAIRLSLSGVLIGTAIVGLMSFSPDLDWVGALSGVAVVLVAKAKHVI